MPHTCATCSHSRPINAVKDVAGECRARPPVGDWKWPRSRSEDYCSEHSEKARAAQPERAPVAVEAVAVAAPETPTPPERAGEDPRAPVPAPLAPEATEAPTLTLDAADDGQAPAPAGSGKSRRGRQA